MPLTRLYRLGPSPQRISKGYVIAGPPGAVSGLRSELDGRRAARDVTVTAPATAPRAVTLDTGWWWLHDRDSREAAYAALTEAAVNVASAVSGRGCLLLPGAVRPGGEASWQDWTVGDQHYIGLLDDVEREVATNLFRSHAPVIIALTGHPGIDGTPEPLGSRRLAESGEHLATRYLASASDRHLSLVEAELRRTTGIRDLKAMDVHPLGPPSPEGAGASLAVRCVDGQAFTGTVIAQAIFLQALAMVARRLVRAGRREGNTDQQLLERRRASAILKGIDARVPGGTVPARAGDRAGGRRDAARVSLDMLALELLDQLMPELGTLEVGFAEFAPVAAWTVALTESAIPRNEAEFLARTLRGVTGASDQAIAAMVAAPGQHSPGRFITDVPVDSARLQALGARWEARLTEAPPGTSPRPKAARPSPQQSRDAARAPEPRSRPGGSASGSGWAEKVQRLAALPEGDPAQHAGVIAALAAELPSPTAELVPWLGSRHRDVVAQARRRLRPPAERQVSCPLDQLRWGSPKVGRAWHLARNKGITLLRTTVGAGERQPVLEAAAQLIKEADASALVAIINVRPVKAKDGTEQVSAELLMMPRGAVA